MNHRVVRIVFGLLIAGVTLVTLGAVVIVQRALDESTSQGHRLDRVLAGQERLRAENAELQRDFATLRQQLIDSRITPAVSVPRTTGTRRPATSTTSTTKAVSTPPSTTCLSVPPPVPQLKVCPAG